MSSVAGWAEHAPRVVAAPVVPTLGTEEDILPAAAMLAGTRAALAGLGRGLAAEQAGQELGHVDREARFPAWAAVGVVLGREPVEPAVDLAELPPDVDLGRTDEVAFQPDGLAPAEPV
ncbi:MAG: hypothetical protein ABSB01_13925 [Streptosporangiaceae bacterium]|jgi:hypothetical protein